MAEPMIIIHDEGVESGDMSKKNKMSGGKDYSIGMYGKNGKVGSHDEENNFTDKDVLETGLNMRKPL